LCIEGLTVSTFSLDLDGRRAGMIRSAMGAVNSTALKAAPKDISVDCGAGMSRDFYAWVAGAFTQAAIRRNGGMDPIPATPGASRLEFSDALIAAVALPELDKSVKNPAVMAVKISPERIRYISSNTQSPVGPSFKP
jgi:hypothetical protein